MEALIFIFITVISRLIPHLVNLTAMIPLTVWFARAYSLPRALVLSLGAFLVSDLLLILLGHHDVFGSWSLWMYSGLLVVALGIHALRKIHSIWLLSLATLFYWAFTNLGTFLNSGIYPHTEAGFVACYFLALPFLGNMLIGDAIFWGLFMMIDRSLKRHIATSY